MPVRRAVLVLVLGLLPLAALASASAEKKEDANPRGFEYVALEPPFVVNFGTEGRVAYLKADVSLRVATPAAEAVTVHMPAIRHELIMLFSRQTPEALAGAETREALRAEALEAVRALLVEAGGIKADQVQDLLFTSFLTQR